MPYRRQKDACLMTHSRTSLLFTHDWNEDWKATQNARREIDAVERWNKRAETAGLTGFGGPNDYYVQSFIRLAEIGEQDTVLDMGCGNGALSMPLGQSGHYVVACDFSPKMIEVLKENLSTLGITTVTPFCMSWEDNWEHHGLTERTVDVAIASRSMITKDLKASLLKLDAVARKRVCITLATAGSPRLDSRVIRALGLADDVGRDYQFALNILINAGIKPELSYIVSKRKDRFSSIDEAFESYQSMVENYSLGYTSDEREARDAALRAWLQEHLIEETFRQEDECDGTGTTHEPGEPGLVFKEPRETIWAFISWNKE